MILFKITGRSPVFRGLCGLQNGALPRPKPWRPYGTAEPRAGLNIFAALMNSCTFFITFAAY